MANYKDKFGYIYKCCIWDVRSVAAFSISLTELYGSLLIFTPLRVVTLPLHSFAPQFHSCRMK